MDASGAVERAVSDVGTERGAERYHHPLSRGYAPEWASAWGQDRYGPWAEFTIKEATQRLRWIPPGTFWMGSPDDEKGPEKVEGPRHLVRLTRGYWLMDTPVTQALWVAVMGTEPSRFQGADRPVEQVSWEDAHAFCERVVGFEASLRLCLPTEAEWEYACRAGTEGARYGALDVIAWYGDNSGRETHPVKGKAANVWGLYDTLGNVWEWCQDPSPRVYSVTGVEDLLHAALSNNRVIRGGSFDDVPVNVRAAYRGGYHPSARGDALGFRCASSE